MALQKTDDFLTEEAYLHGERHGEVKHEYIDGEIYALVGASEQHNRLAATFGREFGTHLKGLPCDAYQSDFKVKIGTKYFYPDVVVKCDTDHDQDDYTEYPLMIVEIASVSTRMLDRTYKLDIYKYIYSLRAYVLVEQDRCLVEVYSRKGGGPFCRNRYCLGDDIYFEAIDLTLSVADIYERIDNEDMRVFLASRRVG